MIRGGWKDVRVSMVLGGAEKMSPTFSVIIAIALEMSGVR